MEKEKRHIACYCCRFYKPFYVMGYMKFDRLDYGLCQRYGETKRIDNKHDCCNNFIGVYSYPRMDRILAMKKLAEAADSINVIMQIMVEDSHTRIE